jgi:(1->4)-alpha-D-glucan 1-alpha-D-glucosylmutase
MLYQALLGAWPLAGVDASFVERMVGYAIKAAREGKQQTSWLAPNEGYETGLERFLRRLLDRQSQSFLDAFNGFARRAALIGALNGLTQVALKATIPGVPDFYQGSELWDLSLVDPDNRRPVDLQSRASLLASIGEAPDWRSLAGSWPDGRVKLALIRRHLALRRQLADVFINGSYRPLDIAGPDRDEVIAFARIRGRDAVIVICGRLFGRATDGGRRWPTGAAWNATVSVEGFSDIGNVLAGGEQVTGARLSLSQLFDLLPVALLRARHVAAKGERPADPSRVRLAPRTPVRA